MDAQPSPPRSWRKRHPIAARVLLYGLMLVVLGGGAWWGICYHRASEQCALLTRVNGVASSLLAIAPDRALAIVRDEVLPTATDPDVVRAARLTEASALDALRRYDESEAVYADVYEKLSADVPRGAVLVPWANMRISAGRANDALELLDRPGALDGWPVEGPRGSKAIRARAQSARPN